jgi:hypothetical protein
MRIIISLALLTTAVLAATTLAPPAAADPAADAVLSAVTAARGSSCAPFRHDPIVQQATDVALRSTDDYLDHNARVAPVADRSATGVRAATPLAVLKDLGSNATRARLLQGAGATAADAIKVMLISGYDSIPDCGYTNFGGSIIQNESSGYVMTAVVLAGA